MASETIYALCEPTTGEIRYIGKTAYPLMKRLKSHISGAKRVRNHRTFWIRSLGQPPIIRALCVVEGSCAGEMEQRAIANYQAHGARLVNQTIGGEGTPGWVPSQVWRDKQKARGSSWRGTGPEVRRKIGDALRGRKRSAEATAKIVAAQTGLTRKPETGARISAALMGNQNARGAIRSPETRAKMSAAHRARLLAVAGARPIASEVTGHD